MRIVVDINHPAHVHYFKNFIWEMERRGHCILITASEKDISYKLLDNYGFDYCKIGNYGKSIISKFVNIPILDYNMYKAVKHFKPDIFLGFGSIRAAHISKMLRKPYIAFDDSEPSPLEHMLYVPLTDTILTPQCFRKDFGDKHVKFNGYIELSYLHPNYFTPNPSILEEIGESRNSKFILMRYVAWKAMHDLGKKGFDDQSKRLAVKTLEEQMPVYISSETKLPKDLEKYQIHIKPENIHDILYYSHLFLGDSQTMTTEAALLGTPVIRCNSFVGDSDMGNFMELEKKYRLVYNFADPNAAIEKAKELISNENIKQEWKLRRESLLADKIDVTAFMVSFLEHYPESHNNFKDSK